MLANVKWHTNKPSAATNHIYLFAGHNREKIALPKTTTTTPIGNRDDDNFQKDENKKFHFACKWFIDMNAQTGEAHRIASQMARSETNISIYSPMSLAHRYSSSFFSSLSSSLSSYSLRCAMFDSIPAWLVAYVVVVAVQLNRNNSAIR